MTSVLDLGSAELRRLCARHSPEEIARARAAVAFERHAAAEKHWRMLLALSVETALTARAVLHTPDFASRFAFARAQSRAAAGAERLAAAARGRAEKLRRAADRLLYQNERP